MGASLFDSIGIVDNLDEPTPFFNRKAVIYSFVIICLVSFLCRPVQRLLRIFGVILTGPSS